MKSHEKRWQAAQQFINDIKQKVVSQGCTHFSFDDETDIPIENMQVKESTIEVECVRTDIPHVGSSVCILFENDPDWDHGLYTPIKEWQKDMKERLKFFVEIKI